MTGFTVYAKTISGEMDLIARNKEKKVLMSEKGLEEVLFMKTNEQLTPIELR